MRAEEKNFIVVSLGDKESYGFDEHTLPKLIQLVDSSRPDARIFSHTGVVAYYLTSPRGLKAATDVIRNAEALQSTDPKLSSLGIGVSEGRLIAEFDPQGQITSMPIGDAASKASRDVHAPGKCAAVLRELSNRIN